MTKINYKKTIKMFHRHFNKMINDLFRMDELTFTDNWEKKTYKSEDGLISFTYITNKSDKLNQDDEIYLLKQKLNMAVEEQEFEQAVELRDKIKKLEKNKEKISELKKELDKCIKEQDFEGAIELRDKINSMK
jgi:excinuclease UvrABC helicase subunit UvrB